MSPVARVVLAGLAAVSFAKLNLKHGNDRASKFYTRVSCWLINNDLAYNWANMTLFVSIASASAYVMIHH